MVFAKEMLRGTAMAMDGLLLTRAEKRTSCSTATLSESGVEEMALWLMVVCRYEFGGPLGVVGIMTGFPILMYYFWICLVFYDGQLVHPTSVDDIKPFLWQMWGHIRAVSLRIVYDIV